TPFGVRPAVEVLLRNERVGVKVLVGEQQPIEPGAALAARNLDPVCPRVQGELKWTAPTIITYLRPLPCLASGDAIPANPRAVVDPHPEGILAVTRGLREGPQAVDSRRRHLELQYRGSLLS